MHGHSFELEDSIFYHWALSSVLFTTHTASEFTLDILEAIKNTSNPITAGKLQRCMRGNRFYLLQVAVAL